MERDGSFSSFNWQSNSHHSSLPAAEMNGSNSDGNANMGDQSSGFLNLNWDQSSTEQTANFESALSSLVSSPTSSNPSPNPNPSPTPDSVVIRELIGRLGSICSNNKNNNNNHGEEQSTNTSCYSTPLNSPPKLNLLSMMDHPQLQLPRPSKKSHNPIPFNADPGFAERAARFSCFGAARSNYAQFGSQEPGKLSRASSSQSLKGMATSYNGKDDCVGRGQLENDMMLMMMMRSGSGNNNSQQESSPPSGSEGNVKKRKSSTASSNKGSNSGGSRAKEASHPNSSKGVEDNSNSKRSRSSSVAVEAGANNRDDDARKTPKAINSTESAQKQEKDGKDKDKDKEDDNGKLQEPPKQDYIHVRARRGQATDSHSLAERVRREKISERMKFLQDLVPGCNKVIGKAVMLDEIINYVQSLQRQVEFLSMKLATVNPRLDFSMDSLLHKDMNQSSYPLEVANTGFSYANQAKGQEHAPPLQSTVFMASNGLETQCSVNNSLDSNSLLSRCLSMHLPPLDSFTDAVPVSQLGAFWEDDLQSVVQMGFGQNQEATFSSHNFQGPLPTSHMKIEL